MIPPRPLYGRHGSQRRFPERFSTEQQHRPTSRRLLPAPTAPKHPVPSWRSSPHRLRCSSPNTTAPVEMFPTISVHLSPCRSRFVPEYSFSNSQPYRRLFSSNPGTLAHPVRTRRPITKPRILTPSINYFSLIPFLWVLSSIYQTA